MTLRTKPGLSLFLFLFTALPLLAQPGGDRPGRGFGGGMGRGMSPDQLLGLLALDEKFALTDEQLTQLRAKLKGSYAKQRDMMEEMFSGDGDFESMRENMAALREEVMQATSEVLDEDQGARLEAHMEEMRSRVGRFGGGRGGRGAGRGRGAGAGSGGNTDSE